MDCRGTSVKSAWISESYSSNRMDNYVLIIVGEFIRGCFQANGTSTYGSNYIVCFKCFLIVGVYYISYGGFQTKFYKLVAVIVYARLKRKVGSFGKLS